MTISGQLMGYSTLRTKQRYIAQNFEYQQAPIDRLGDQFGSLIEMKNEMAGVKNGQKLSREKKHREPAARQLV